MRMAFVVAGGVDRSGLESILWLITHAGRHHLFVYVLRYRDCPRTIRPGRVRSGHK
jgi:hypothetical protein